MSQSKITKVAGPLVVANGMKDAKMFEVVRVSKENLIGEVIELHGDDASIQVYEDTSGIGPGEPVEKTGQTMSVELGPGLLQQIYDGIQRPLELIEKKAQSSYISRGIDVPGLDHDKKWEFKPVAKAGDKVVGGDILGEVDETTLITHKVMVPPEMKGTVKSIESGNLTIDEVVAVIETDKGEEKVTMLQKWPIRVARPFNSQKDPSVPLVTGTRILDTLFPIMKGGAGAIPGPFGAGKTVTQQTLAKYCDAQVIIYIGCGERGNEMTDVLMEFPELIDPHTNEPLMKRTCMIANTSNMPVAAREASVYTGITIAEYYRDMGYNVALMADSTSRWAEAMREMSGRLEEMPGEEGYPAYLGSRTAGFYERAGYVQCLGSDKEREGSLTVVGAVSPPGGDFSEPVTQNTLRVTKVFWALDAKLANKRHFPSINWLQSYSLYLENMKKYANKEIAEDYMEVREMASSLLQEESKLEEIVRLVGADSLSPKEQLVLETAKAIREDFLFQNAFDKVDAYTSLQKQYRILRMITRFYKKSQEVVDQDEFDFDKLRKIPVREKMVKAHFIEENKWEEFDEIEREIEEQISALKS
ncbi:V-type ATP synthase subunit A [Candidatus Peribacteria bacterium]|jgi:V/A-type H+/Na+-transporting ATPase subunit A|nr:V-type ATP synthase subunit A [Candidatus Peribacteria bacterium]MBT4020834.1 V-type ATP synthase subunit A [Candidatus Peribacteria bacterium]MBT4241123.1 V-type ATP synthase subunit A [Candidatus Peribacteria bacterium]MBT4473845.1 V-type ATP synthase subunit A [Candidatus Peribacteria bacterium]